MPSASTFTTGSVPGSRTHNLKNQAPLRSSSCPIILIGLKFIQTCARRNLEALSRACLLGKEIAMGSHPLLCLSHHLVPFHLPICFAYLFLGSIHFHHLLLAIANAPSLALGWPCHSTIVERSVPKCCRDSGVASPTNTTNTTGLDGEVGK